MDIYSTPVTSLILFLLNIINTENVITVKNKNTSSALSQIQMAQEQTKAF